MRSPRPKYLNDWDTARPLHPLGHYGVMEMEQVRSCSHQQKVAMGMSGCQPEHYHCAEMYRNSDRTEHVCVFSGCVLMQKDATQQQNTYRLQSQKTVTQHTEQLQHS
eukprot:TRINITY_DN7655_c0_g2_i4.p1 TRINITY_DN7655_c0_g2~~TRINITY_DN7655_c0_g2_i4.p1  ORF type:complete len:107 (+),score=4.23 TRINITY_DN7655_c0_g2_i4:158-478(+)